MGQAGHTRLFPDAELAEWITLSDRTSEHKVLTRLPPRRVVKVTWPGFYGQIPVYQDGKLHRINASPSDYLERQALQIEVFAGDLVLEGVNISDRPSMVINEPMIIPQFGRPILGGDMCLLRRLRAQERTRLDCVTRSAQILAGTADFATRHVAFALADRQQVGLTVPQGKSTTRHGALHRGPQVVGQLTPPTATLDTHLRQWLAL